MWKTTAAALSVGLLVGLLLAPTKAIGASDGSINDSLMKIADALKEISRNVDDQRTVCECRCK
jgi:hypothetical protein